MTRDEQLNEKHCRDERNRLNAQFTEKNAEDKPRGRHGERLFYWGVRSGELRRIYDA
jgi:hypothetical protein